MATVIDNRTKELYNKARISFDKKDYDYAKDLAKQVLAVHQDFAEARQLLHQIKQAKWNSAKPSPLIKLMAQAVTIPPLMLGALLEMRGEISTAIDVYEKALSGYPYCARALLRMGILLRKIGAAEAALVVFEEAYKIHPDDAVVLENLGELHSQAGDYDKARFCFKAVLKVKPHDANAERGLKNIDALGTIERSFKKEDYEGNRVRIREIRDTENPTM